MATLSEKPANITADSKIEQEENSRERRTGEHRFVLKQEVTAMEPIMKLKFWASIS